MWHLSFFDASFDARYVGMSKRPTWCPPQQGTHILRTLGSKHYMRPKPHQDRHSSSITKRFATLQSKNNDVTCPFRCSPGVWNNGLFTVLGSLWNSLGRSWAFLGLSGALFGFSLALLNIFCYPAASLGPLLGGSWAFFGLP